MDSLLAVDLGLKTGLALYNHKGRLVWFRSHHYGNTSMLRRGIFGILNEISDLSWLVLEGGGNIAEIWIHQAERRHIPYFQITAEVWRKTLLYPREMRNGIEAKQKSIYLAINVIDWSGIARPNNLQDDTSEAILIGLWGVIKTGWLKKLPFQLKR